MTISTHVLDAVHVAPARGTLEVQLERLDGTVVLIFEVTAPSAHHHVPLLLSPFAYSTYREQLKPCGGS